MVRIRPHVCGSSQNDEPNTGWICYCVTAALYHFLQQPSNVRVTVHQCYLLVVAGGSRRWLFQCFFVWVIVVLFFVLCARCNLNALMPFARSITSSLAWSFACLRPRAFSIARSVARLIAHSTARSFEQSLAHSLAQSMAYSIAA